MLLIAAAVALASVPAPPSSPTSATAQATATIRIVEAVRISFAARDNLGAPPARDSVIRASDGTVRSAKLVEFQ
jgi:hypothetical protein